MSVPNYKTVAKIAARHSVDIYERWERGFRVIELCGRGSDLEQVVEEIGDGYAVHWDGWDLNRPAPFDMDDASIDLYSGRVDWAKLGY